MGASYDFLQEEDISARKAVTMRFSSKVINRGGTKTSSKILIIKLLP